MWLGVRYRWLWLESAGPIALVGPVDRRGKPGAERSGQAETGLAVLAVDCRRGMGLGAWLPDSARKMEMGRSSGISGRGLAIEGMWLRRRA